MRLVPLLLVSVSLLVAGCAKEDDPPAGDDQGTTTTTTPPTGGNATTTTTNPTGGNNDTAPPAPTPMELCAKTKDFTPPNQAPSPPEHPVPVSSEVCGTPGAGYTMVALNVTWAAATAVPATNPVSPPVVKLLDSTGTAAATCTGPTGQTVTGECMVEAAVVPGEYTLQYESAGNLRATISVTVR